MMYVVSYKPLYYIFRLPGSGYYVRIGFQGTGLTGLRVLLRVLIVVDNDL